MSVEIKNCPFCGHEDVEIDEISPSEFAVTCQECSAIGPASGDVMGAISAWNFLSRLSTLVIEAIEQHKEPTA